MFRSVTVLLLVSSALLGDLFDFKTLENARSAYDAGKYDESAALYDSLEKRDDIHYNLGDAYYKDKKYKEAITEFKQVNAPHLKAKALHNLGNAYAQSKKVDEAINAYEEALKLGDDEDTRFNLELLKKQKQEQQNQQNQQDQNNQDQKDQKNKEDQQNKQNQDKQNQKQNDQQKQQDQQKKEGNEKQQNSKDQQKDQEANEQEKTSQKERAENEQEKDKEEVPAAQKGEAKEQPISDMQERKYEKMLDKRGIKTLMVPLKTEGARDEETTAW